MCPIVEIGRCQADLCVECARRLEVVAVVQYQPNVAETGVDDDPDGTVAGSEEDGATEGTEGTAP